MTASSYARGNVVYHGGTTAPTRGTVDPMGYINRGLNNPSQTRSGLAQAALSRLSAPPKQPMVAPHNSAAYQAAYQASIPKPTHTVMPNGKLDWMHPTASPAPAPVAPDMGMTGNSNAGVSAPVPVAPTMDTMPVMHTQAPAAHDNSMSTPYDPVEAAGEQTAMADRNNFLNQLTRQRQQVDENYTNQRRDAELQHPQDQLHLLNSAAGRGMAFSSGYGYDVGQQEDKFANLLSTLDRSHTLQNNDLLGQQTGYEANYGAKLQELKAAAVARLAQQAGDLGLNDPAPTPDPTLPDLSTLPDAAPVGASAGPVGGPWKTTAPAVPAPVAAPVHAGTRSMSSFSAAAQAKLKAGQPVVGGDGRVMKLVNGVPTSQGMVKK